MKRVIIIGEIPTQESFEISWYLYSKIEAKLFEGGYSPVNPLRWFYVGYTREQVEMTMLIESQFCESVVFATKVRDEIRDFILSIGLTVISKLNYDVQKEINSIGTSQKEA